VAIARSGTPQAAGSATAATSITVTIATGTNAGDIDVVGMVTQAAGTAASIAAAGWTLLGGSGETGGGVQTWLWWKLHAAGDPATVTVAISGAGAAYSWDTAAYAGADPVTPFGTVVKTVDSTADTTVTTSNITTTGANSWLIWFAGTGSGSSILTPPTAVTYTVDKHIETGKSSALASAGPLSPQTVSGNGTQSGAAQSAVLNIELFASATAVFPHTFSPIPFMR
jgi:hypothetical protein